VKTSNTGRFFVALAKERKLYYTIITMSKKIYVIGHKNPDTDSVISAAAYARLKQLQGQDYCFPARAGKATAQTEYIFKRFGVDLPPFLPDLIPKAEHYISETLTTVNQNDSVWNALELLQRDEYKVLPIVDENGVYQSMFHYRSFAQYIITNINPRKKSAFPLSLDHLSSTIHAQPVTMFNGSEVKKSRIIVAASYTSEFIASLKAEGAVNALVIVGDRWDIQKSCLELGVRALILSNGKTLSKEFTAIAEKNKITVLSSPFDTISTAMLIIYSATVDKLGDTSVPLVHLNDPVRSFRMALSKAPSRHLAVADNDNKVVGVISEGDLAKDPNVEVIMVDHNELSQAIDGIENYKILEIIDHHRLGNVATSYPITFINRVVGATCTIITNLYREQMIPLEKGIASILLSGILVDTLMLKSSTTTETDIEAAEYLASITGLDTEPLFAEIHAASNSIISMSALDLITMDSKEYNEGDISFAVCQIEIDDPEAFMERKDEIMAELETMRMKKGHLFAALLVTDITKLDSLFVMAADKPFISLFNYPAAAKGVYELKGIVSRKKQLMPILTELISRYAA